jgi:hypothetical protein
MVFIKTFNKIVDEESALKMMRDMQSAREKQIAALEAAQKKYLEEKRLVSSFLLDINYLGQII